MMTWATLFTALDAADQRRAMQDWWESLDEDAEQRAHRDRLQSALAATVRFRKQQICRMPQDRLLNYLNRYAASVLLPIDWINLFVLFHMQHRNELMMQFHELIGISLNDEGITDEDIVDTATAPPSADLIEQAARQLVKQFGRTPVEQYLAFLAHIGSEIWCEVDVVLKRLRARSSQPEEPVSDAPAASVVNDQFTTLDRVLIDQVVASSAGDEGALDADALEDLIETVIALNGNRYRSHFHRGFMHGLMPGHELWTEHPDYNEHRRIWYLTGALMAKARQLDRDSFAELLRGHRREFAVAAETPGEAGSVMANALLDTLFRFGHLTEVLQVLKGQLGIDGFRLAQRAYQYATDLWRQQQSDAALPILRLLQARIPICYEEQNRVEQLLARVERRTAQCLQSVGDFEQASAVLQQLLARNAHDAHPDLHADLGLIAGGFRSMSRLHLPADPSERNSLRAALQRGKDSFLHAIATHGDRAANAAYAIALHDYLHWADTAAGDAEAHARALRHVDLALSGMRGSSSASVYEQMGLIGQAMFMQVVLTMDRMLDGEDQRALAQWERIPADAGRFPEQDIHILLTSASLVRPSAAAAIAESVCRLRDDAANWALLRDVAESLITRSTPLLDRFLALAEDTQRPRALRFDVWQVLVPLLLREGRIEQARVGLDALQTLSETDALKTALFDWLIESSHHDPAWNDNEAQWARIRLACELDRTADVSSLLVTQFHRLRADTPEEAAEFARLLIDWSIDKERGRELLASLPAPEPEPADIIQRLRDGETVNVLFVGGNEIQANYDGWLREQLRQDWPGVSVKFRHTGWSSNWGRDVDQLIALANVSDAVVIMSMIRTLLGQRLRAGCNQPWVPCTGTGRQSLLRSIQRAVMVVMRKRTDNG